MPLFPRQRLMILGFATGLVVLAATAGDLSLATAAEPTWSVGTRVGVALEGAQHTLENGLDLGLVLDRAGGGAFVPGVGLNFVYEFSNSSRFPESIVILSAEAHLKTSTLRRAPYLEIGVGYYWGDAGSDVLGPGGYAGGGWEFRPAGPTGVGVALGVAYHVFAAEVAAQGGNAEDYWTLGAILRW